MEIDDLDTLKAIERNGVAHSVYWCHWPNMRMVDHPHAIVTESDLPCPFFNNVFSADIPESDAESVVDDLIGRFQSRGVPCFWWSGPVNHDERVANMLKARGFVKALEAAAMAIDLAELPSRDFSRVGLSRSVLKTGWLTGHVPARWHLTSTMPCPVGGTSCSAAFPTEDHRRCAIWCRTSTANRLAPRQLSSRMESWDSPASASDQSLGVRVSVPP